MPTLERIAGLFESPHIRQLDRGLFSAFPDGHRGDYDRKARAYDAAVGLEVYNRLFWGVSREDYRRFAAEAAAWRPDLPLADLGCGTMRFTADAYRLANREIVAVDTSQAMLRMAQGSEGSEGRVTFLQSDATASGLQPKAFGVVALFGMLHLFDRLDPVLAEAKRLLAPGGAIFASTIVTGERPFSDRYRTILQKSGEMGPGRTVADYVTAFEGAGLRAGVRTKGAFAFFVAERK